MAPILLERNTDPAKDRYGITAGPAPGIEALRGTLDPSQQTQLDAIVAFEVKRRGEAYEVIEDLDRYKALNLLSNHWAAQEAAGGSAAAGPVNTQRLSEASGSKPTSETERLKEPEHYTSGAVSQIDIHPEVANTRINAHLLPAVSILVNQRSSTADVAQAHTNAQSAYELAHGVGNASMMARCQFYLGLAGICSGSVKRALVHFQAATEVQLPYKEGIWARAWIDECEKVVDARGDMSLDTSANTSRTSSTGSQDTPRGANQKERGKGKGKSKGKSKSKSKSKSRSKAPADESDGAHVKEEKHTYTGKGRSPAGGMNWSSAEGPDSGEGSREDNEDESSTDPTSTSTTPENRRRGSRVFSLRTGSLDRENEAAESGFLSKPRPKPMDIARNENEALQRGGVAGPSATQQGSDQHSPPLDQPETNEGGGSGNDAVRPQSSPLPQGTLGSQPPQGPPQPPPQNALQLPPQDPTPNMLAGLNLLAYNAGAYSQANGQPAQTAAREALERDIPYPFANERWEIGTPIPAPENPEAEAEAEGE